jgi:cbb3-type cytochrome oxidase subunit 3
MRLSDIMSGLDLTIFPKVALVIFLGVFVAVVTRALARSRRAEFSRAASMPLDDGPIQGRNES